MNIELTTYSRRKKTPAAAIAAILAAMLFSGHAFGQVIRLHPDVTAEPRQSLRLGDIATVSGTDTRTAEGLLNLVVLPEVNQGRTVRAEAVLMAVIAQLGPGKLADNLQVSGRGNCKVQMAGAGKQNAAQGTPAFPSPNPLAAAQAPAPAVAGSFQPAPGPSQKTDPHTAAAPPGPTLSKLIVQHLQQDLAVGTDDLRVSFDTMSPLLDQPAPANHKWVFRTMTHSRLGTVQMEAQLVEGSRIVQKLAIQMEVTQRATVLVTTAAIQHGDVVTPDMFHVDEAWLDRSMPTYLTNPKEVVGLEALRDLTIGTTMDQRDFHPVAMASRGDIVSVIFRRGNVKVQMKGRAVNGGKLHESIQIKNEETNELYDAMLIGRRLAYVGDPLSDAQEKKLREAR